MTIDERDECSRTEIEKALGQIVPEPPPPGLRQKVLGAAFEARGNAVLTPGLRIVAVACSILLVIILGVDPILRRSEFARMAALLDGRSAAPPTVEDAADLAEVLGGQGREANTMARLQVAAASAVRKNRERDFIEARKRLKGWFENETSEDLN